MARTRAPITALTLSAGFARTVCSPLSAYLIEHLGWREACFVYAAIQIEAFGRRFKRLHSHLAAKHGMAADDYKKRFGLPWTRGLTSATSLANSGWTDERKAKARTAQKSRFFDLAHSTPRRELAPFLKTEAVEHLGVNAKAFGEKFDAQVRALEGCAFGLSPEC